MSWPYLGIATALAEVLRARRLILPVEDVRDVAAAALSSQFLLFAGPSGTGKSIVADAAASLLTHPERRFKGQPSTAMANEAEFYGYATTIGGQLQFQPSRWLSELMRLEIPAAGIGAAAGPPVLTASQMPGPPQNPRACAPVLLIEEANLGLIEGYMSSFMRDFSGPGAEAVTVALHSSAVGLERTDGAGSVPSAIHLGRWPRVFGSLNVDQTSEPPARKVSARGLVLVFEPQELSHESLASASTATGAEGAPGHHYQQSLMSPSQHAELLRQRDQHQFDAIVTAAEAMAAELSALAGVKAAASPRTLVRVVQFMSAYVMVALDDGEEFESSKALALEFGVLHSVLPSLPEPFFLAVRDAVTSKDQPALAPMAQLDRERSPLLKRLKRAQEAGGADFWAAFS